MPPQASLLRRPTLSRLLQTLAAILVGAVLALPAAEANTAKQGGAAKPTKVSNAKRKAVGDAALAELKHVVHDLGSRVVEKPAPVPVKWKGPTLLVPDHPEAGRRIHAFDKPVRGAWSAVRSALLTHGIVAPIECLSPSPLVEVRRGRGVLRVG
jgi:hypothetical protein